MSLINDALAKVERDRAEEAAAANLGSIARAEKRLHAKRVQSLGPAVVNSIALLFFFAVVITVLLRNRSDHTQNAAPAVTTASIGKPPELLWPAPVVTTPAPESAAPSGPAEPDYELAGMSALGSSTLLSIIRRSDKRSIWIPIGKTVGEITAVSYDAATDQAVINVNGQRLTLAMHDGPTRTEPLKPAE